MMPSTYLKTEGSLSPEKVEKALKLWNNDKKYIKEYEAQMKFRNTHENIGTFSLKELLKSENRRF